MISLNPKVFQQLAKDMNYYDYAKYTNYNNNIEIWNRILYQRKSVDVRYAGIPAYIWGSIYTGEILINHENHNDQEFIPFGMFRRELAFHGIYKILNIDTSSSLGGPYEWIKNWKYKEGVSGDFLIRWVGEYTVGGEGINQYYELVNTCQIMQSYPEVHKVATICTGLENQKLEFYTP